MGNRQAHSGRRSGITNLIYRMRNSTVQTLNDPKIIVALDFPSQGPALALADQLDPAKCRLKVGKELVTRSGPELVNTRQSTVLGVFLSPDFRFMPCICWTGRIAYSGFTSRLLRVVPR